MAEPVFGRTRGTDGSGTREPTNSWSSANQITAGAVSDSQSTLVKFKEHPGCEFSENLNFTLFF